MEKRTLKDTDLAVSRIAFGTMTFGVQVDGLQARCMIDFCLERGINFFDTANVYGAGRSEEILGAALAGRRDKAVLATKVAGRMGPGPDESGLSRAAILRAIEDSLRRLRTDYIDIYYLHQPDPATPLEETLETMERLVESGKIRYAGTSNFAAWQICRMLWLAEKNGYRPVRIAQPVYSLIARGIEPEFLPMARALGISIISYNPLAGGLLTGKHTSEAPLEGTRFVKQPSYFTRYWHAANLQAVEKLREIARAEERTLVSLALNWVYRHTPVDCVILGASRLEQLEENLRALDEGPLSEQALRGCDEVWSALRGVAPRYNR